MYESKYGSLEIPDRVNGEHTELMNTLMKEYRNPESFLGRMFKVTPNPMSSGEVALINIFSSIYKVMLGETEGNILLIVDEIDAFLHPKWQQDILMRMVEWMNREEKRDGEKKLVYFCISDALEKIIGIFEKRFFDSFGFRFRDAKSEEQKATAEY